MPKNNKNNINHWTEYATRRNHYTQHEISSKKNIFLEWMLRISPKWIVDLGCNTGEFSFLAAQNGASVIAVDADHDSINELYRTAIQRSIKKIYPVVSDITDLGVYSGFLGAERESLISRLKACGEVVICLGLLHHLIAGKSVPINDIIQFLNLILGEYLIIELISDEDPMVVNLMSRRRRIDPYPNLNQQYEIFASNFQILDRRKINANRELVLFKKLKNSIKILN